MFIIRTVYRSRLSPESFATFSCTILLPRTSSVWSSIRMESTKPIIVCMRNENRTKFVLQEIEVSDSVDAARFAIRRKYWTERPKRRVTVTNNANQIASKQAARPVVGPPHYAPAPGLDLWPFDLKSGVRVTCDVGYLCANFSLPGPLCSRLRPDVRYRRQTSDSRPSSLNAPAPYSYGWGIISFDCWHRNFFGKIRQCENLLVKRLLRM